MAHIHDHRARGHGPRHIRHRHGYSPERADDERGLRGEFGDKKPFRGNGSIPGRRRHGGLGNAAGSTGEAMAMGAGLHGSMSGRGPKGYVRSDGRIREDVCDCLADDPHLDASAIEVQVESGDVMLSGTVDSRRASRHAQDLAERPRGVRNVHSTLRVHGAQGRGKEPSSRQGG